MGILIWTKRVEPKSQGDDRLVGFMITIIGFSCIILPKKQYLAMLINKGNKIIKLSSTSSDYWPH